MYISFVGRDKPKPVINESHFAAKRIKPLKKEKTHVIKTRGNKFKSKKRSVWSWDDIV